MDCSLPRLLCPWDSPGKNTGVGCCALFQGNFLTQRSNLLLLHLPHGQIGSLPLAPPGNPVPNLMWLQNPSWCDFQLVRVSQNIIQEGLTKPFLRPLSLSPGPCNCENIPCSIFLSLRQQLPCLEWRNRTEWSSISDLKMNPSLKVLKAEQECLPPSSRYKRAYARQSLIPSSESCFSPSAPEIQPNEPGDVWGSNFSHIPDQ